jgi:hypothetical protein
LNKKRGRHEAHREENSTSMATVKRLEKEQEFYLYFKGQKVSLRKEPESVERWSSPSFYI